MPRAKVGFFRRYPEARLFLLCFFALFLFIFFAWWREPAKARRFANVGAVVEMIDVVLPTPPADALENVVTADEAPIIPVETPPVAPADTRVFHTPTSFGDLLAQYEIAIIAATEPALVSALAFDFPEGLLTADAAGRSVIVRVGVDADGAIAYADVEQSVSPTIDAFVLRTIVTEAKFTPALDFLQTPIPVEIFMAIPLGGGAL